MMCWSIWHHRNQLVWKEWININDVTLFAKLNFEEWINAQKLSIVTNHVPRQVEIEHWTKTVYPRIKVNVDGAVFLDSRHFGYGCVARDSLGMVVKAKHGSKEVVFEPLLVEAMSIKEALSWIKDRGWTDVILESDCLTMVADLNNNKNMVSPYGSCSL
uniref:RNase H type-1 domain-containing protein n=1 Tax=Cannabis sativa TaxID=3483 RepID=A0A803NNS8_CANSA